MFYFVLNTTKSFESINVFNSTNHTFVIMYSNGSLLFFLVQLKPYNMWTSSPPSISCTRIKIGDISLTMKNHDTCDNIENTNFVTHYLKVIIPLKIIVTWIIFFFCVCLIIYMFEQNIAIRWTVRSPRTTSRVPLLRNLLVF